MSIDTAPDRSISRRSAILGGVALGSLLLAGCSPSGERKATSSGKAVAGQTLPDTQRTAMTVYRDPSCGCCESWARIAEDADYQVTLRDDNDMAAVKRKLGVPAELASCHTAVVDGYVVEGHVPLEDVDRVLRERPAGIQGIAVPGMPIGSPGMEMPDGRTEPFQVIAFDASGNMSIYRTYLQEGNET